MFLTLYFDICSFQQQQKDDIFANIVNVTTATLWTMLKGPKYKRKLVACPSGLVWGLGGLLNFLLTYYYTIYQWKSQSSYSFTH